MLFYIADSDVHQDQAFARCCLSMWSLQKLFDHLLNSKLHINTVPSFTKPNLTHFKKKATCQTSLAPVRGFPRPSWSIRSDHVIRNALTAAPRGIMGPRD